MDKALTTRETRIVEALQDANIPVLLMVLVHLTGDLKWLNDPFIPTRTKGMAENNDGGLTVETRAEVVQAARAAVLGYLRGAAPQIVSPDDKLLARMLAVCLGDHVPTEYIDLMREEAGFVDRFSLVDTIGDSAHSAIIIGAGVSGLAAGAVLKRAGIPFTILEKSPEVGGTWYHNRYPGCGVDTPSYLYSYSFQPEIWKTYFAGQPHVRDYLERFSSDRGVIDHIRLGTEVVSARYDEADHSWLVETTSEGLPDTLRASILVSAVGQLNVPRFPTIAGLTTFAGVVAHSARWPEGLDVAGKRVAVVGTGATAMQLVPAIAKDVAQLTIFQRSAQWVAPNENLGRQVPPRRAELLESLPFYREWYRIRLAWTFGDKVYETLQVDPAWISTNGESVSAINDAHRRYFKRYLDESLQDRPDLLELSTPDYPPYTKRLLLDAGWFDAIKRNNVELQTQGISHATAAGLVDVAGTEHEFDIIIFATGFNAANILDGLQVIGKDGTNLHEQWGDAGGRAYLGMTVPKMPNFFMLYGPNTNLGHGGSLIFLSECQIRYIMTMVGFMTKHGLSEFECRQEVFDEYNAQVDARHKQMLWGAARTRTWYTNATGRVVTNSPWKLVDYWRMTHAVEPSDYSFN